MSSNMSGKVFADNTGCVGWYRYYYYDNEHDNKGGVDCYGTGIVMIMSMITRSRFVIMMFVVLVMLMIMMFMVSEIPLGHIPENHLQIFLVGSQQRR